MDSSTPSRIEESENLNYSTNSSSETNPEEARQKEPEEQDRKDVQSPANDTDLELGDKSCLSQHKSDKQVDAPGDIIDIHKAVVLEQIMLVKSLTEVPTILIDEKPGKLDDQEANCVKETMQVEPSELPSEMIVDELNTEKTPTDIMSTSQKLKENVEKASLPDNSSPAPDVPILSSNPEITANESQKKDSEFKQSSLALLAQYDTDSNSDDDVCEVPIADSYQNRCVEIESDSSTSDVEFLSENHGPINLETLDVDLDDEDDEENVRSNRQPKVKGELHLDDLPPIEDLHITVPEEECTELGKVHSIVDQLVIVDALPGTVPLDLETVLFRDKGKQVLGEVFDVLGQVSDPLYCVRFNSHKEIKEKGIEVGQTVYVAPRTEHTQFVILANLMKVRGSDASWENDVEPPPRFIDYSDDEEERSARRPNRKRQSSVGTPFHGRGSYVPRRPYRGSFSSRGIRQNHHQPPGEYNIVGNSWHSNFHQPPNFNHRSPYRMPNHATGGNRPPMNNAAYQHPPVNPGLVINPYAVYQTPHSMQQPLFPPQIHQPPPPPPH